MRVFATRSFTRFCRSELITDAALFEALKRAEAGLIDADLGGSLIKQRVARRGHGRSGGYRVIIAIKINHVAIFLLGFAKADQQNIGKRELDDLKDLARSFVSSGDTEWNLAIKTGAMTEIEYDRA
jgi:hypothetical protein